MRLKKAEKEKPKGSKDRSKNQGNKTKGSKPKAASPRDLGVCSVSTHLVFSPFSIPDTLLSHKLCSTFSVFGDHESIVSRCLCGRVFVLTDNNISTQVALPFPRWEYLCSPFTQRCVDTHIVCVQSFVRHSHLHKAVKINLHGQVCLPRT